jgi:peroxiredoxin
MKLRNVGILLLFVVVLAWFGCSAAVPGVPISGPAPDFTLHDLSGNPVRLSEMRGKVVLLNFWATWCPPCREEVPSLVSLQEKMAGTAFVMLTVAVDDSGATAVEKFFRKTGKRLPTVLDPDSHVSRQYGVSGIPETFIIDKQGNVVKKMVGALDWGAPNMVAYLQGLAGQ